MAQPNFFLGANRFLPILTELIRKRILFLTKRIQIETELNAVEMMCTLSLQCTLPMFYVI